MKTLIVKAYFQQPIYIGLILDLNMGVVFTFLLR